MNFFGGWGSNNGGCDSCSLLILILLLQCLGCGGNGGIDLCTLLLILLLTGSFGGSGCMNKC